MAATLRPASFALAACAIALAACSSSSPEPLKPPDAPTGFAATPYNAAARLTWNASARAATYSLHASITSGLEPSAMTLVASGLTETAFNAPATNGVPNYFRVTAVNAAGTSPGSAEASATPDGSFAPPAPLGVTATPGDRTVTIAWDDVPPASSYKVYWAAHPGVSTADAFLGSASTSTTHVNLTNGTTYHYAVAALIGATESTLSAEVSATPAPPLPPPYIGARAMMGGMPNQYEVKVCTSSACTVPVTNATVTISGTTLAYDGTDTYAANPTGSIAGAAMNLWVTIPAGGPVAAGTYTASGRMYTAAPALTQPTNGATWLASQANTFTWSAGSPTTSSMYALSAFCLSPFDLVMFGVATTQNSYVAAANTMSAGSWTGLVEIASTSKIAIPNTLSGSGLSLGAASAYVTFTVR